MESIDIKEKVNKAGSPLITLAGKNIKTKTHRWVTIDYGLNDEGDFIWHFSNHRRARPFPEDFSLFNRILFTHLSKVIPDGTKINAWPSPTDWEKKVISVVAFDIEKNWNFDEDDMEKPLETIADLMSDEIERLNPRKTRL